MSKPKKSQFDKSDEAAFLSQLHEEINDQEEIVETEKFMDSISSTKEYKAQERFKKANTKKNLILTRPFINKKMLSKNQYFQESLLILIKKATDSGFNLFRTSRILSCCPITRAFIRAFLFYIFITL